MSEKQDNKTNIVIAIIGAIATISVAIIGYMAVINKPSQETITAAQIIPTETETPIVVADTNSLMGWIPVFEFSNGNEIKNGLSIRGNAIELAYDVGTDGYVVITKNIVQDVLLDTKGISFLYKGSGSINSIEFKLILKYSDGEGDTTYGFLWNRATDTNNTWIPINLLYSDMACWWPEDNCLKYGDALDPTKVIRLDFVVSSKVGDDPGSGIVLFSDVVGIRP